MMLKTFVQRITMYGCETKTIGEAERKEAFKISCYRRMLKIKQIKEKIVKKSEEKKSSYDKAHIRRGKIGKRCFKRVKWEIKG